MKTYYDYITEVITDTDHTIIPNKKRKSGDVSGLIYLTKSKKYANAYANGLTSGAHVGSYSINDGVLIYCCLDDVDNHYGGDVWVSGFKDDILDELQNYNKFEDLSPTTQEIILMCGYDSSLDLDEINYLISYFEKDDLSLIPIDEWSDFQSHQMGYDEICIKSLPNSMILKTEMYINGSLYRTINGGCQEEYCDAIYYHGSPIEFWEL